MNCLLVDDEPLLLRHLERVVSEVLGQSEIKSFTIPDEAAACAETMHFDIAFLDIQMRGMDGLTLAGILTEMNPEINIIFCTGYSEYALEAFNAYASDYLVKPITADQLRRSLQHLRHPLTINKRVRFHCFGNFKAYCDGNPITFSLSRTSELLAYLVDRNGAECRVGEIVAVLFEDDDNREYYKKLRQDLLTTFRDLNILDCLYVTRGGLGIRRETVDCDYFDYKDGKLTAKPTEYMSQYSFGEYTFPTLL